MQSMKNQTDSDKGFHVTLLSAKNIASHKVPLYLQFGVDEVLVSYKEGDYRETISSLAFPINLSYKHPIIDKCSFEPFFGVNFRCNVLAQLKDDSGNTLNYFDQLNARRFQFGLNVGGNIDINGVVLGYRFNPDLMNFFDIEGVHSKSRYHFISVGVEF